MTTDVVNHPQHYKTGGVEVIDLTEQLDFNRGNAVKYLARAGKKNPDTELEDLKKAQWYVNRAIKKYEKEHPVAQEEEEPRARVSKRGPGDYGGSRQTA